MELAVNRLFCQRASGSVRESASKNKRESDRKKTPDIEFWTPHTNAWAGTSIVHICTSICMHTYTQK